MPYQRHHMNLLLRTYHLWVSCSEPAAIKRLYGLGGGTQEVLSQEIDSLTIDNSALETVDVEFGDIQADFGISGFAGNDILSNFLVTIDFEQKEIHMTFRHR